MTDKVSNFSVIDLLTILSNSADSKLLTSHKAFQYKRIGRSFSNSDEVLSKDDQDSLQDMTAQLEDTRNIREIREIVADIENITRKQEPLRFTEYLSDEGHALTNLVFSEKRLNISLRVRKEGFVDLSSRDVPDTVPSNFPTFVYRTYTILRDGDVAVSKLPCRISSATLSELYEAGLPASGIASLASLDTSGAYAEVVFNLEAMPAFNKTEQFSQNKLFYLEWALLKSRAMQKVCKYYKHVIVEPDYSGAISTLYGEEAAKQLQALGITDKGGFSPKLVVDEPTDSYMGRELSVKIKSFSALPSVSTVLAKMVSAKKLTPSEELIKVSIDKVTKVVKLDQELDQKYLAWLDVETESAIEETRSLLLEKYKVVAAALTSPTYEDSEFVFSEDGHQLVCSSVLKEVVVAV